MTTIPTIDLVDALAAEYADKSPSEILALALNQTGEIAISFSGAEDVVLIDMAANLGKPFRVFSLDTGRLHTETYQFIETVRKHYNINIEICFPEADAVQQLVNEKGMIAAYKLRQPDQKRQAVKALHGLNFRVIAAGDSYNDTTMLGEADHGFLFDAPENVIAEFPQFPAINGYEALKEAIRNASIRDIPA